MISPTLNAVTRYGLAAVALLGGVVLLRVGELFFIPFVIALLLAALLLPIVRWLHRVIHIPWPLSCVMVVVGVVLINLGLTLVCALAIPRLLQDLPDLRSESGQREMYRLVRERMERITRGQLDEEYWPQDADASRVFKYVQTTLSDGSYVAAALLKFVNYLNNWLWWWILILFIVLFLLMEGEMLTRRLPGVIGAGPEVRAKAATALKEMAFQVRNYLWWRTVINLGLAVACGVFYHWMGLRHGWIWALLTAILCYVPYLGPIAAGGPPVLEAFLTFEQPWYALAILVVYVIMITLEGYFFFPWLIGRGMELNATTVMLSCLFWELVWGLPGLFLAMPMMAAVKAICEQMPDLRPWATLMASEEEEESPPLPVVDEEMSIRESVDTMLNIGVKEPGVELKAPNPPSPPVGSETEG